MKTSAIALSLCLFLFLFDAKLSAQENFEVDAKVGYAYSVLSNYSGNSGFASSLNLGWRKNRNCFGLTFNYYNQSFTFEHESYPNQYYSGGIYYAYQLIEAKKLVGRLGGAFCVGGASSWYSSSKYGIAHFTYGAAFAPKVFFNGHYAFTKHLALSYEVAFQLYNLGEGAANSGVLNFSPQIGFTYLF